MAKKRTLDRSKPYGSVFGSGSAVYEQFGILFDGSGKELPGFEEVEIPVDTQVVVVGDDAELKAQIRKLLAENEQLQVDIGKVRSAQDEAEAKAEEIQGQLDTATVEIERLKNEIHDLTKPAEPSTNPADDEKKNKQKSADIDAQLSLQTGGAK